MTYPITLDSIAYDTAGCQRCSAACPVRVIPGAPPSGYWQQWFDSYTQTLRHLQSHFQAQYIPKVCPSGK